MIKWSDELIRTSILKCMEVLDLKRMPTAREIVSFYGNGALHNKICKTKHYSGWAKELGLAQTDCETRRGNKFENIATEILNKKGYTTSKMSHRSHFDILVNDKVKIDVKSGNRWHKNGYQTNTFGINKKYASCDIYMMFVLDDNKKTEKIYIIPSCEVKCKTTMSIGEKSKYDKWTDRYDVLDEYIKFYKKVVM